MFNLCEVRSAKDFYDPRPPTKGFSLAGHFFVVVFMKINSVDIEKINRRFSYVDGDLVRNISINSKAMKGMIAGTVNAHGYVYVSIESTSYAVHHVVWKIHYGDIPDGYEIDHIDRNRQNNKIKNLRIVTSSENNHNIGLSKANASGHRGIRFESDRGKWLSRIKHNGRMLNLGRYFRLSDAISARKAAEKALLWIDCR